MKMSGRSKENNNRNTMKGNKSGKASATQRKPKSKGIRILNPMERQQLTTVVSVQRSAQQRFCEALLRFQPRDFLQEKENALLDKICPLLELPLITSPISSQYDTAKEHFAARASLVLEESRHAIHESLLRRWDPNTCKSRGHAALGSSLKVACEDLKKEAGRTTLELLLPDNVTTDQLLSFRPGTVVECSSERASHSADRVTLGVVLPWKNAQKQIEADNIKVSIVLFREPAVVISNTVFITPLTSLLSAFRQFEACCNESALRKLPFLSALLGSPDGARQVLALDQGIKEEENAQPNLNEPIYKRNLNMSQRKAADQFLNNPHPSITIVQGPPGTGKTSLLVSVLCSYLTKWSNGFMNEDARVAQGEESIPTTVQHRQQRIMVCAPTNRAVSLLATRFLDMQRSLTTDQTIPYNIILVGDADKLLEFKDKQSPLRSIFIYNWMSGIVDEYKNIRMSLFRGNPDSDGCHPSYQAAVSLRDRLQRSIPKTLAKMTCGVDAMKKASQLCNELERKTSKACNLLASKIVDPIMKNLASLPPDVVAKELVTSAHVIFCTLASAGSAIVKKAKIKVDDLVVDEAAAATEPELYIPIIQMQPKRLLAVGDPMQLPATVMSQKAARNGLSQSLHDRLMYKCEYPYVMLDVQYRMKPEIVDFPSKSFYDGSIRNGANVMSHAYQHSNPHQLLDGRPYSFLEVSGQEHQDMYGSYRNEAEASIVVNLLNKLIGKGSSYHVSENRVRVITFYQAQVRCIKSMIERSPLGSKKVLVATVDSSQGCEADVVIISFVRSSHNGKLGFLSDDRRVNVALTRAKYQLIAVGNVSGMACLGDKHTIGRLMADAKKRHCVLPAPQFAPYFASSDNKSSSCNNNNNHERRPEPATPRNDRRPNTHDSHGRHHSGPNNDDIRPRHHSRPNDCNNQARHDSRPYNHDSRTRHDRRSNYRDSQTQRDIRPDHHDSRARDDRRPNYHDNRRQHDRRPDYQHDMRPQKRFKEDDRDSRHYRIT